ncbi:hypothetical protein BB558_003314 [Smittium angustum]|uniref:2-aminomuconate deaminase n=1 Tax=Smittium angustum TaxID=133377 RepID=A0A2U1J6I6_SMIAN|nr:hypothetical protein BB558_003314 [Smittium angustum]
MSVSNLKVESLKITHKAQPLAGYPHAKRVGPFVYISGLSSRRPDNTYAGVTENEDGTLTLDIKEQTRTVIMNIKETLELLGGNLHNLVDVTVFLVNMNDFDEYNKVYNEFFNADNGPARTTVEVSRLPGKLPSKLLIEIKSVAYIPE